MKHGKEGKTRGKGEQDSLKSEYVLSVLGCYTLWALVQFARLAYVSCNISILQLPMHPGGESPESIYYLHGVILICFSLFRLRALYFKDLCYYIDTINAEIFDLIHDSTEANSDATYYVQRYLSNLFPGFIFRYSTQTQDLRLTLITPAEIFFSLFTSSIIPK